MPKLLHGPGERGQDLIEFALIMPLLILLTLGVIEFGVIISNYNTLANAVREGARYGTTHPNEANSGACDSGLPGVVQAACQRAANLVPGNVIVVSTKSTSGSPSLTVRLTYHTRLLTTALTEAIWDASDVTLQASATMQIEQ
jgi:Flp pilus assembly protein TadG